jgi:hypothetical protein
MVPRVSHDELIAHLCTAGSLEPREAAWVVGEVLAYFGEPTEAFVRRRHAELRLRGLHNDEIFERIGAELADRLVAPPPASPRQLRRMIYG